MYIVRMPVRISQTTISIVIFFMNSPIVHFNAIESNR